MPSNENRNVHVMAAAVLGGPPSHESNIYHPLVINTACLERLLTAETTSEKFHNTQERD